MTAMDLLREQRFIAILRHIPVKGIEQVADALYAGGIRIFEVTFDPSSPTTVADTQAIIRTIRARLGDGISVGAGTVINVDFVRAAHEAGAEFIVSPCTKEDVITETRARGMLSIPGAYTPTEILHAYEAGADIVKVFPVAPHEVGYLRNVMSPLSHIPFIPTGGINPDTAAEFLATGAVAVAAGATVVTQALAEAGDYATIEENARRHVAACKK